MICLLIFVLLIGESMSSKEKRTKVLRDGARAMHDKKTIENQVYYIYRQNLYNHIKIHTHTRTHTGYLQSSRSRDFGAGQSGFCSIPSESA